MNGIEFFAGTSGIKKALQVTGLNMVSLDFVQLRGEMPIDLLMDFLDFEYQAYNPNHFNFLYFGFPCTTFSKASGGKHFIKSNTPVTSAAHTSILMMQKMFDIINYFDAAIYYIENPAGGLCNNELFKSLLRSSHGLKYRVFMGAFGFPTSKQTDIFTNSTALILSECRYRSNGRYSKQKFDNLTLKKRQKYPVHYCEMIALNFLLNIPPCFFLKTRPAGSEH
jgi:hypothetical protein